MIAHSVTLRGDAGYVNQCFERYAAVKEVDVRVLAEQLLQPDRRTVVHVSPAAADGDIAADAAGTDVLNSQSNGAGQ